jgi:hypothetical protein
VKRRGVGEAVNRTGGAERAGDEEEPNAREVDANSTEFLTAGAVLHLTRRYVVVQMMTVKKRHARLGALVRRWMSGRARPSNLEAIGITAPKTIHHNLSYPELFEQCVSVRVVPSRARARALCATHRCPAGPSRALPLVRAARRRTTKES